MAVPQSRQKSSAKSKLKAPSADEGRRSGPSAQERLVLGLIELMQQGVAPWRKPWDGSGGGHHCNLISGHRYRGSNPILLTLGIHIRGSALARPSSGPRPWSPCVFAARAGALPLSARACSATRSNTPVSPNASAAISGGTTPRRPMYSNQATQTIPTPTRWSWISPAGACSATSTCATG